VDKITFLMESGNYLKDAVLANDVTEGTFYRWLQRGEADQAAGKRTLYADLCESATCARAKANTFYVGLVLKNAERGTNASACFEFLSRTDPEKWAKDRKPEEKAENAIIADELKEKAKLKLLEDHPELKLEYAQNLEVLSR